VILRLFFERAIGRAALILGTILFCVSLLALTLSDFIVYGLSDERLSVSEKSSTFGFILAPLTTLDGVSPATLATAALYLPNSSRLQYRLADYQQRISRGDFKTARTHAENAVRLSPHDFEARFLLAQVEESAGDRDSARRSARAALTLAPTSAEANWHLSSLLLSDGKLHESLEGFRLAAGQTRAYLEPSLAAVWREGGDDLDTLQAVTPQNPESQFTLARFLLRQARPDESAAVFRKIAPSALIRNPQTAPYLDELIAGKNSVLAYDLWRSLVAPNDVASQGPPNPVWNGSFESDILIDFAHFDWAITPSSYARISIDKNVAREGRRSLRIDYLGRETTRLENEIKHLIVVHPGTRYRLNYYVRTEEFDGPTSPSVSAGGETASPASMGSHEWEPRSLEFVASAPTVSLRIDQKPRYSYEDPTRGTVWFDDFQLQEISKR